MSRSYDGGGWRPEEYDLLDEAADYFDGARNAHQTDKQEMYVQLAQAAALVSIAESLRRIAPDPKDDGALGRAFPGLRDAADMASELTIRKGRAS